MGPSPTCHLPEGEEFETVVELVLPLWEAPAVGYCSERPRPSPISGSRFVGERAVGPWMGVQKPLGKNPLRGNPSPEMTYLPTLMRTVGGRVSMFPSAKYRVGQGRSGAMKMNVVSVSHCMIWFKVGAILPKMRPKTHTVVTCTLSLSVLRCLLVLGTPSLYKKWIHTWLKGSL